MKNYLNTLNVKFCPFSCFMVVYGLYYVLACSSSSLKLYYCMFRLGGMFKSDNQFFLIQITNVNLKMSILCRLWLPKKKYIATWHKLAALNGLLSFDPVSTWLATGPSFCLFLVLFWSCPQCEWKWGMEPGRDDWEERWQPGWHADWRSANRSQPGRDPCQLCLHLSLSLNQWPSCSLTFKVC